MPVPNKDEQLKRACVETPTALSFARWGMRRSSMAVHREPTSMEFITTWKRSGFDGISPGAGNEFVPHAAAKLQGYDIAQSPSFRKRGIVVFSTTPGFNDLADFAAKMKLSTIGLHARAFGPQSAEVGLADAQRALSLAD